jgi:lysophospholipase L1-like esterase
VRAVDGSLSRRALLVGGAALAVAACSETTRGGTSAGGVAAGQPAVANGAEDAEPGGVAMIGDSITEGSLTELMAAFGAAGIPSPLIDGDSGRRIESGRNPLNGVQVLTDLITIGVNPAVWVIALGTNDAGNYDDEAAYGALIDLMLGKIDDERPLVWIDVYRPDNERGVAEFNDALRSRLADRGNAVIGSWFELATRPDAKILQRDRVHPNDEGRKAFAQLVVDTVTRL